MSDGKPRSNNSSFWPIDDDPSMPGQIKAFWPTVSQGCDAEQNVCRTHGGASTGPRTPEGRQRCSDAKTVHGRETRAIRAKRDAKLRELRELEHTMKAAGLIT